MKMVTAAAENLVLINKNEHHQIDFNKQSSGNLTANYADNKTLNKNKNINYNNNSTPSSTTSDSNLKMNSSTKKGTCSDARRNNKPIMEKRRRARINNCLNELKNLLLDAMKKDPARHSKLEKADILEMTVKYLSNIQKQQNSSDLIDNSITKFRSGFSYCFNEVSRYPGLDTETKTRLLAHLSCCAKTNMPSVSPSQSPPLSTVNCNSSNGNFSISTTSSSSSTSSSAFPYKRSELRSPVQVHILPNNIPNRNSNDLQHFSSQNVFVSNGIHLVPTKLPNGDVAFILPNNSSPHNPSKPKTSSKTSHFVPISPNNTITTNFTNSVNTTKPTAPLSNSINSNNNNNNNNLIKNNNTIDMKLKNSSSGIMSPRNNNNVEYMDTSSASDSPLSLVMPKKEILSHSPSNKSYDYQMHHQEDDETPWRPWSQ